MHIKNIAGLEKPLEKLIETVSQGIGVVANHRYQFDVAKAKRIGQAEAENEKRKIIAKAEGNAEAIAILQQAKTSQPRKYICTSA
tara:strand:+ start:3815 stop:4069 length:255 start_codon:yes stop_codon:yes gene_type:complete